MATSQGAISSPAVHAPPAAVQWAVGVARDFGTQLADGRWLVPYSQARLAELRGWRKSDGRVSRYLHALGPAVERSNGQLVIDLHRLQQQRPAPGYLRALPTPPAGPASTTSLEERINELEQLVAAKDQLIAALLAERALNQVTRGSARQVEEDRADPRGPTRDQISQEVDVSTDIPTELDLSSDRAVPRDRAEPRETQLDWSPDEIAVLVGELSASCERHAMPGITGIKGLVDAFVSTARQANDIRYAQHKIALQLDCGHAIHSPFGLLVRAAREGWPEYFPPGSASASVLSSETVSGGAPTAPSDRAEEIVTELEAADDPYLATLDAAIATWDSDLPPELRKRLERFAPARTKDRHASRVEAWRYLEQQRQI